MKVTDEMIDAWANTGKGYSNSVTSQLSREVLRLRREAEANILDLRGVSNKRDIAEDQLAKVVACLTAARDHAYDVETQNTDETRIKGDHEGIGEWCDRVLAPCPSEDELDELERVTERGDAV